MEYNAIFTGTYKIRCQYLQTAKQEYLSNFINFNNFFVTKSYKKVKNMYQKPRYNGTNQKSFVKNFYGSNIAKIEHDYQKWIQETTNELIINYNDDNQIKIEFASLSNAVTPEGMFYITVFIVFNLGDVDE